MLRELIHHTHVPYALVVDIGSGSVGVGVIEIDTTHEKPLIIYAHRERIRNPKDHSPEEYIRILKEAVLAATLELSSNGLKALRQHAPTAHVDAIKVVYAAPWAELASRKIILEKPEPVRATHDLVESLVKEALAQAHTAHHEEEIFAESGLEVVHEELIDGRLNGYPVTDFKGQECVSIEVVHLSELVPRAVRATLAEASKNLLPHPTITERSFARIAAGVVRTVFPHNDSFVTVEMTGGGTELTLVEDGTLRESFCATTGTHAFEQEVAERLGTIESEVRTHIRDYATNTAHDEVTGAIDEARTTYRDLIAKLLSEAEKQYLIPNHLITIADPDYRDTFLTIAEEAFASISTEYTTRAIDQALLDPFVEYAGSTTKDQYISMIALFFHTDERNRALISKE
jgi:hypothetical protein